jgi:predicted secreted hydrolase
VHHYPVIEDLSIGGEPFLCAQELDLLIRYWKGAMDVEGIRDDKPAQGEGYLEVRVIS